MKTPFIILALFFIFSACNNNTPGKKLAENAPLISRSYTDDLGREIKLPKAPQRVISIAPNITEIVYAIGAGDKLIAASEACDYPQATDTITRIATYPALDMEQLQYLNPDLILTTNEIFSTDQIARIEALGNPVFVQSYTGLDDVFKHMRMLGKMLGVETRANAVADSLSEIVARVKAETDNQARFKTMVMISDDPLIVAGSSGILHDLISLAGGENAVKDLNDPYPTVTPEYIVKTKPEIIILPTKDEQLYASIVSQSPWLSTIPADINKRVYIIDPDLVYRPGPRMVEGLLIMTQSLHSALTSESFVK
ncbi:MAG: ABC transporter substrate-binding protein [Bacteroidia bacterium]